MQTTASVRPQMHLDEWLLIKQLTDVLEYAAHHLPRLDEYSTCWKEEDDAFLRRQDKVAAEAILLAYLAFRGDFRRYTALENAIQKVYQQAKHIIATERNEALLRRFPQTAPTLGVGYVMLFQMGYVNPTIEEILRNAIADDFVSLNERSTFRMMDARWTFALLDSTLMPPVEDLLPLTTLAASPHPIYTMNEDEYAITHALYYLTDFGRTRPKANFVPAPNALLDPFLMWNAIQNDLDLIGEFLIAGVTLGLHPTPAMRFAWDMIDRAWAKHGGLIGPEFSEKRFAELDGIEAKAYAFSKNYHTIFVGGILCAIALQSPPSSEESSAPAIDHFRLRELCICALTRLPDRPRPYEMPIVSEEDLPEWMTARLLSVMNQDPTSMPPWLQSAMLCSISRIELVEVLYNGLLVSACRQYALVQLAEALAVGSAHQRLRSSVTFGRALEFLLAQQLDSGVIGVHELLSDRPKDVQDHRAQVVIRESLAQIARSLPV